MKNFLIVAFTIASIALSGQNKFIGTWQNFDDEDGKPKSHIEITEENGKLIAKVIKLLPNAKLKICSACTGTNKNKSIEGMSIMSNMSKISDSEYGNGEILNPKNGKIYSCTVTLEKGGNKIKVRGYVGISMFGKTQYWEKVK
jgi:uncharacterized protein (DUF2147 family)